MESKLKELTGRLQQLKFTIMKKLFWLFAFFALFLIGEGATLLGSFNGAISLWGAFLFIVGALLLIFLWGQSSQF